MDETAGILDAKGQVRSERVEDLMVEVSTGKHLFERTDGSFTLYSSRSPTNQEQERARVVYAKSLHECIRIHGLRTRSEMETLFLKTGDLDAGDRKEKLSIIAVAEKLGKLREKTTDPRQKLEIDSQMMDMTTKLLKLETAEEQVLQYSAENQAENFRTSYLVSCCTGGGEMLEDPVWESWSAFQSCDNHLLISDARRAYMRVSQGLSVKIIRALARTSEWRSRWKSVRESGNPLFDGSAISWDRNKLNLIYWSDFYDSVLAHPDCPAEDIVRNDDHLQEWLTNQINRKNSRSNQPAMQKPTPTRGGKAMQKTGETHREVNTPYRIRSLG